MKLFSIILQSISIMIILIACESTEGLKPVAGVGGEITYTGTWPDSIQAIALIVLDTGVATDIDNVGNYLVSYSNPTSGNSEYFIQLESGPYTGVIVGLLVDPGLFAVNIDEYLSAPELPIVVLSNVVLGAFLVQEDAITAKDWVVDYDSGS